MFSSESYDTIFATDPEYNCQYKRSSYLPVWRIVASKLAKDDVIMDFGCGPGQFAGYLHDMGFTRYRCNRSAFIFIVDSFTHRKQ